MFKSLERKLVLLSLLLVGASAVAAWLVATGRPLWGAVAAVAAGILLRELMRGFRKYNSSVIFLLNAIENGDYSFSFAADDADATREKRDVNAILNVIKDILVRAREEQIENEKFLSLIVAAIPTGIAIVDERDFVRVANDAALRMLGMHVFTHVKQLGTVDESVLQAFRELTPGRRVTVRVADEREERLVSMGMSRIRVARGELRVVSMYNIAGELEEREMESWIKLIRVMTHEIMNSIAPITSLSETMLHAWADVTPTADAGTQTENGGGEESDKLRRNTVEAFGTITATARGLLSFVESYRRFTGIPKPVLRPVALAGFAAKMAGLEAPMLQARGIVIDVRADDDAITVEADEGQIGQVLVNLLKNAAEAIGAERTDNAERTDDAGTPMADPATQKSIEVRVWRDGSVVRLDVSNNGAPIPPEVLPHIFVPFFTTKSAGTGIGLSISRYIMRLHGGNLKHHTEAGRTVFSMVFPYES